MDTHTIHVHTQYTHRDVNTVTHARTHTYIYVLPKLNIGTKKAI